MSVAPTHLVVDPHTHSTVNLTFDASGLEVGSYDAQMVVASNDPDEPALVVPVSLGWATSPRSSTSTRMP